MRGVGKSVELAEEWVNSLRHIQELGHVDAMEKLHLTGRQQIFEARTRTLIGDRENELPHPESQGECAIRLHAALTIFLRIPRT